VGLNKKRLAYFLFNKEDREARTVTGDELKLRYKYSETKVWEGVGQIVKVTQNEEVVLELKGNPNAPVGRLRTVLMLFVCSIPVNTLVLNYLSIAAGPL
jgi:hypothetical protein